MSSKRADSKGAAATLDAGQLAENLSQRVREHEARAAEIRRQRALVRADMNELSAQDAQLTAALNDAESRATEVRQLIAQVRAEGAAK